MVPAGNTNRRLVRRTTQLFAGLVFYGLGMALMIESRLGLTSWDVFHQGLSRVTGLSFGWVVILLGVPILVLWIPLRQRPGFGTVANLVVIGFVVDGALATIPAPAPVWLRIGYLVAGIVVIGLGTGLYIGARMGPGPRDGLMTGMVARFPRLSIRLVRTVMELSVLGLGWVLGGTVGIGTLAFALSIGPLAQVFIPMFTVRVPEYVPDLASVH
ncbi:MAG TPA: hypothetical protein VGP91_15985 [Actinoplanes sp.]|nr:hypothetical protein [Actinoplanes sp.]